ncbi:Leucine-rich_repeat domain superfamily [Hexamita inflata]|uniref:Leucine-rich repeat domain superfamily n=1 Tax=Hexamita inflata TaxID=28002 RepID=A0AA86RCK3_9EUKA|nr:Leucine-rich repeat domain superfamily [Hexamita inflata]
MNEDYINTDDLLLVEPSPLNESTKRKCEFLDISKSSLNNYKFIERFQNLTQLIARQCKLTTFNQIPINILKNLQILDVQENYIQTLRDLPKQLILQNLYLQSNPIKYDQELMLFSALPEIQIIDIEKTKINSAKLLTQILKNNFQNFSIQEGVDVQKVHFELKLSGKTLKNIKIGARIASQNMTIPNGIVQLHVYQLSKTRLSELIRADMNIKLILGQYTELDIGSVDDLYSILVVGIEYSQQLVLQYYNFVNEKILFKEVINLMEQKSNILLRASQIIDKSLISSQYGQQSPNTTNITNLESTAAFSQKMYKLSQPQINTWMQVIPSVNIQKSTYFVSTLGYSQIVNLVAEHYQINYKQAKQQFLNQLDSLIIQETDNTAQFTINNTSFEIQLTRKALNNYYLTESYRLIFCRVETDSGFHSLVQMPYVDNDPKAILKVNPGRLTIEFLGEFEGPLRYLFFQDNQLILETQSCHLDIEKLDKQSGLFCGVVIGKEEVKTDSIYIKKYPQFHAEKLNSSQILNSSIIEPKPNQLNQTSQLSKSLTQQQLNTNSQIQNIQPSPENKPVQQPVQIVQKEPEPIISEPKEKIIEPVSVQISQNEHDSEPEEEEYLSPKELKQRQAEEKKMQKMREAEQKKEEKRLKAEEKKKNKGK